ncbi:MAG: hypothetical protein ABIP48_13835 [Planctomycetota bacterium]
MALELHRTPNVGVFVPDLKEDYLGLVDHGFACARLRDLPWNVLEHFGGDIRAHCWETGRQLGSAVFLQNSETVYSRRLLRMFREKGQPTLDEFRCAVQELKSGKSTGLTPGQADALRGRIAQICAVLGERACRVRHGFQPQRHDQESIVIGIDVGDARTEDLFVTWVLHSLFRHNKDNGIRPNRLRVAVIADEGEYTLRPRPKEFPSYLQEQLCHQHQEFGIALIGLCHESIAVPIQANLRWKILLSVGHAGLMRMQADAMGMNEKQYLWSVRHLGIGNAVIQTPKFSEPLVIALFDRKEKVAFPTNDVVRRSTETLVARIREYAPYEDSPSVVGEEKQEEKQEDRDDRGRLEVVPGALALGVCIAENAGIETVDAYKKSGLKATRGNLVGMYLLENGLIQSAQCNIYGGRGRQPVILEATRKGIEFFKKIYPGLRARVLPGKGGLHHRGYQNATAVFLRRRGKSAKVESRNADIGVERKDGTGCDAIEIVNENSHNVRERIDANRCVGFLKTIVVRCDEAPSIEELRKECVGMEAVEIKEQREFRLPRRKREKGKRGGRLATGTQCTLFDEEEK